MKLCDLNEASYHRKSYVMWMYQAMDKMIDAHEASGELPHMEMKLTDKQANIAIEEISQELGKPNIFQIDQYKTDAEYLWSHIHDRWDDSSPFFISVFIGKDFNTLLVDFS